MSPPANGRPIRFRIEPDIEQDVSRRDLLTRGLMLGALAAWPTLALPSQTKAQSKGSEADSIFPSRRTLTQSEFVYVSPLRKDGTESTCHGEVWYAWLDDTIVLITAKSTWKARALHRGLDSARIWVGDHGRWKGWVWNNESFRQAPSFRATATIDNDPALLDRLMNIYETKYPTEFSDWEGRQRSGFMSGERIILRYSAIRSVSALFLEDATIKDTRENCA